MIRESVNGGDLQCYLFDCLHCGKHLVWMDFDRGVLKRWHTSDETQNPDHSTE